MYSKSKFNVFLSTFQYIAFDFQRTNTQFPMHYY